MTVHSNDVPQRVPIKEYFEEVLKQMDLRFQQRFDAQERAIAEYKASSEKRLESMNEFRGTVQDVINKCITRQEALALIVAVSAVSSAIVGIVGFFLRR